MADKNTAWAALQAHYEEMASVHMRSLFDQDPGRFASFGREACGLYCDFSKHRATGRTLELLCELADAVELRRGIDAMFGGQHINNTEDRAVLHVALRNRSERPILDSGADVMPDVNGVLERMGRFSRAVRGGEWRGHTGKAMRDVVNIGIGGSDLGPAMVNTALYRSHTPGMRAHFVSNIDALHLEEVLNQVDAETTLFIVASKTFGTQETLTNAMSARRWLVERLGDEAAVSRHFVAVSTNAQRVSDFGIDTANMFGFWDWVGGRYSVWSAVGLSLAVALGMETFEAFLSGAHAMDEHFRTTPWQNNLPVLHGLLAVWYRDFFQAQTHAVLPYDYGLRLLPDYLQQLFMESNGKRVTRGGEPVADPTCAIVWGAAGNNGQHAFYQLMHQGTALIPADFIVALESQADQQGHQDAVLANAFGQTEALMRGRNEAEARAELEASGLSGGDLQFQLPHRLMPGNQPTTSIVYQRLTPEILGALVALYEHSVFVQGVCWDINSFDQWGVELGKKLASKIEPELRASEEVSSHDASTNGLINLARSRRT